MGNHDLAAMSRSAKSVFYFGVYIALLGVLLIFSPNTLLELVNLPPTNDVWIRLVGMLLIFMGFFYIQAARHNLVPFFKWTLATRGVAIFFVLGFWLSGLTSWIILAFWLGDLAGLLWTWISLRVEERL
ncbi:MAG: hypothetical protein JW726_00115 [Anaerolineales bacterium]|nr:hypothetical protein [Anaerolineales bacterium]